MAMPPKTKLQAEADAKGFDFSQWLTDHMKPIVFVAAVVVVVGVGFILFQSLKKKDREQHWTDLLSTTLYASPYGTSGLLDHLEENGSDDVLAHTLLQQAIRYTREKEFDQALGALDRLETEFPDSYLTVIPSPDIRFPIPGALRRWIRVEQKWDAENGYQEPALNTDRVALVETSKGAFWIGFYPDLAPEHVEHFITCAKSGKMNGTSVTSITGTHFKFGGEASRDDDPFNDVPENEDNLLEPGPGRFKAQQDRGSFSAIAVEGGESATRFAVVTGSRDFEIEKRQTIFGRVLNDRYPERANIDEIANTVTYGNSPGEEIKANIDYLKISDHPVETIRIERVTIWSGDKIEDGHDFDVSEVKKPVPDEDSETTTDEPEED